VIGFGPWLCILDNIAESVVNFFYRVLPLSGRRHGLVKTDGDLGGTHPREVVLVGDDGI